MIAPSRRSRARPLCGSPAPGSEFSVWSGRPGTGTVLAGRYRLTEPVGRGATGSVWRACDALLRRDVAVKPLLDRHGHGPDEARMAALVRHPNVAVVHDLIRHDGSYWRRWTTTVAAPWPT